VVCYVDVSLCMFQYYLLMQPQVRKVDGRKLINDIKVKMEKMIQKRVDAVRVSLQLLFFFIFHFLKSKLYDHRGETHFFEIDPKIRP